MTVKTGVTRSLLATQDDYLDCYGAPEVIGKIGTDIEDNKCSWLVVQALERVTPEQRKVLEDNYGKKNAENVCHAFSLSSVGCNTNVHLPWVSS
jgi:geranylgeranyl pyrophosphate synthase